MGFAELREMIIYRAKITQTKCSFDFKSQLHRVDQNCVAIEKKKYIYRNRSTLAQHVCHDHIPLSSGFKESYCQEVGLPINRVCPILMTICEGKMVINNRVRHQNRINIRAI